MKEHWNKKDKKNLLQSNENQFWEMSLILSKRFSKKRKEYIVSWINVSWFLILLLSIKQNENFTETLRDNK